MTSSLQQASEISLPRSLLTKVRNAAELDSGPELACFVGLNARCLLQKILAGNQNSITKNECLAAINAAIHDCRLLQRQRREDWVFDYEEIPQTLLRASRHLFGTSEVTDAQFLAQRLKQDDGSFDPEFRVDRSALRALLERGQFVPVKTIPEGDNPSSVLIVSDRTDLEGGSVPAIDVGRPKHVYRQTGQCEVTPAAFGPNGCLFDDELTWYLHPQRGAINLWGDQLQDGVEQCPSLELIAQEVKELLPLLDDPYRFEEVRTHLEYLCRTALWLAAIDSTRCIQAIQLATGISIALAEYGVHLNIQTFPPLA